MNDMYLTCAKSIDYINENFLFNNKCTQNICFVDVENVFNLNNRRRSKHKT